MRRRPRYQDREEHLPWIGSGADSSGDAEDWWVSREGGHCDRGRLRQQNFPMLSEGMICFSVPG